MLSLNDGQDAFGHIVTITESPVKAGLIYVGCDTGKVQISKDDGKTFTDITAKLPAPAGAYVSRVVASKYAEGRIYVTFEAHRSDDFHPYVFVSEDFGENWKPLNTGLDEGNTVKVIREHHRKQNLLFLGTERGAFVSFNRGGEWKMVVSHATQR